MGTTKYYCGDYLLSLHNKDNEYQHINNNDLQVEYVEQGIIYPIEFSHTNTEEDNQYGGVCDKDNVFVELSKNTRIHRDFHNPYKNWYIGANPNVKVDDIDYINEEVVFIGAMHGHFGHFLFESLNRLWYFLENGNKKYKAAFILSTNFPNKKFLDLLILFGLKEENLIHIKKPTRFKNVIVPEPSYYLNSTCHPKFKEIIETISKNVTARCKNVKIDKKIYFSKKHIGNKRALGEKIIAEDFKKNGYKIVYPESLSMHDYVMLLSQCKSLVCTSATNAHNCIFLPDNSEIIILERSNHIHYIQTMIDQIFNLNTTYIQCHKNILPVSYSAGPFLLDRTNHLIDFYKDRKMKRDKKNNLGISDIYDFLKQWANLYQNTLYRIENNGKEYIDKSDIVKIIEDVI